MKTRIWFLLCLLLTSCAQGGYGYDPGYMNYGYRPYYGMGYGGMGYGGYYGGMRSNTYIYRNEAGEHRFYGGGIENHGYGGGGFGGRR